MVKHPKKHGQRWRKHSRVHCGTSTSTVQMQPCSQFNGQVTFCFCICTDYLTCSCVAVFMKIRDVGSLTKCVTQPSHSDLIVRLMLCRTQNHPLVSQNPGIRFFAAAAMTTSGGLRIGAMYVHLSVLMSLHSQSCYCHMCVMTLWYGHINAAQ